MHRFLAAARAPRNLRRATLTALIVGPILAVINQTETVWMLLSGGAVARIALLRISLTFAVPFLVSLASAALADAQRREPS
ncbi:MAG: hypothetical protein KY459_02770 [Acidobacteria bacterium]|nr:hypothetical protein [Acidobacteriota bacterium]